MKKNIKYIAYIVCIMILIYDLIYFIINTNILAILLVISSIIILTFDFLEWRKM